MTCLDSIVKFCQLELLEVSILIVGIDLMIVLSIVSVPLNPLMAHNPQINIRVRSVPRAVDVHSSRDDLTRVGHALVESEVDLHVLVLV